MFHCSTGVPSNVPGGMLGVNVALFQLRGREDLPPMPGELAATSANQEVMLADARPGDAISGFGGLSDRFGFVVEFSNGSRCLFSGIPGKAVAVYANGCTGHEGPRGCCRRSI